MADIELTTSSTLNAGSITVTLYEDVGGDGSGTSTDALGNSYDNSASVSLAGGIDETNTLTGFDGGTGNDYWLQVEYGTLTNVSDDTATFTSYTVDTAPYTKTAAVTPTASDGAPLAASTSTSYQTAGGPMTAASGTPLQVSSASTASASPTITATGASASPTMAPTTTSVTVGSAITASTASPLAMIGRAVTAGTTTAVSASPQVAMDASPLVRGFNNGVELDLGASANGQLLTSDSANDAQ